MSNGDDIRDRAADHYAVSPEASDAEHPLTIAGFWDGAHRLYLNRNQSHYLEFDPGEVSDFGPVGQGAAPFPGEEATWVELAPTARVDFVRTGHAEPDDDFAVEVHVRSPASELSVLLRDYYSTGYRCTTRRCAVLELLWDDLPIVYP
jgi:hypothetical protein